MKTIHRTEHAPAPVGPYSQAVEVGSLLFCSGQISIDPQTNQVMTGPVAEQTRLVMDNVGAVLKAAGLTYAHVVKTTIFLTNMADFAQVNDVYATYFPGDPPARSDDRRRRSAEGRAG